MLLRALEKDIENEKQTAKDIAEEINEKKKQRLSKCEEKQSLIIDISDIEQRIEEKKKIII